MGAFEYLLLFAAVILGLAVSDIAISLHRLLNASARVRWDWLPLLAAILAFERIVAQWWSWYRAESIARGMTFGMFMGVLVSAVLLFLMAAAALPDEIGEHGLDLREHYRAVSRRYWLLFGGQWLTFNAVNAWTSVSITKAVLNLASPLYLIVPATLVLAFVRHRGVQAVGLIGFIALYTTVYFGQTLG